MLTVTPAARARLLSKLHKKKIADGFALRFTRTKSGWKLRPDQATPRDTNFAHDGRIVLLLNTDVAQAMASLTLDVSNTPRGARLKLRRIKHGGR